MSDNESNEEFFFGVPFDEAGKPVFPVNNKGLFVLPKDENGVPLFPLDLQSRPIFPWDHEKGVPTFPVDDTDEPIFPRNKQNKPIVPTDANGHPIFPVDESGKKIFPVDESNRPIPVITIDGMYQITQEVNRIWMMRIDKDGFCMFDGRAADGSPIVKGKFDADRIADKVAWTNAFKALCDAASGIPGPILLSELGALRAHFRAPMVEENVADGHSVFKKGVNDLMEKAFNEQMTREMNEHCQFLHATAIKFNDLKAYLEGLSKGAPTAPPLPSI